MPYPKATRHSGFIAAMRLVAAAAWMLAAGAGVARAQFLVPDPQLEPKRAEVMRALRDGKAIANPQVFDDFFNNFALAMFAAEKTVTPTEKAPAPLVANRNLFRKNYSLPAVDGPPRARMNELALAKFKEILRLQAPPDMQNEMLAVKYNVVLALGELNEQEGGPGVKARPLPGALPVLLALIKTKDGKATGAADTLRAAALVAVQHHAESESLSAESRINIQQTLIEVLKQKTPEGRDQAVHDWMRRRSAETLGIMKDPGPRGAVVKAIDGVLRDPEESLKLRGGLAAVLKNFKFTPESGIDCRAIADHIGHFIVDSCKDEFAQAKAKDEDPSQRRLKTYMQNAMDGLGLPTVPTSLSAVAGNSAQKIVAKARAIEKLLDDKTLDEAKFASMNKLVDELPTFLTPRDAAPNPPEKGVAPKPAKKPSTDAAAVVDASPRRVKAPVNEGVDARETIADGAEKSDPR